MIIGDGLLQKISRCNLQPVDDLLEYSLPQTLKNLANKGKRIRKEKRLNISRKLLIRFVQVFIRLRSSESLFNLNDGSVDLLHPVIADVL